MNVLLGLEGSDESIRTLRETVERAAAAGDDLTIAIFETDEGERGRETVRQAAVESCEAHGIDPDVVTVDDDHPGSELVRLAEAGGYDRLVIGGGTESPMGKIQLGPVTEFVLLNAQTSVTLVR